MSTRPNTRHYRLVTGVDETSPLANSALYLPAP